MNKIHQSLEQKYPWYNKWHHNSYHQVFHWLIMMVFIFSSFSVVQASISSTTFTEINPIIASKISSRVSPNLSKYTVDLLNALNDVKKTPPGSEQATSARLLESAKARKLAILEIIKTDPQAVIDNALSDKAISELPADVQSLIEKEVTIKGKFEAFHADNANGSSQYEFYLTDEATSKRYTLHFPSDKLPNALTNDRIQAHGVKVDNELALGRSGSLTTLVTGALAIAPNTFGPQKTLLILVNFTDNTTQPYTIANAQTVVTSTSNFDMENSYGQTSLTGVIDQGQQTDVRGWYTIPMSSTVCDTNTMATQAKNAAIANGINTSNYTRIVYGFPQNACTWWGLSTVGGSPSQSWINGSFQVRVLGHEMGHSFGLYHSHSLSCPGVSLGSNCTMVEYGDSSDIMGAGSPSGQYTAFQKERLGWLNYGTQPPIQTVQSSGTYALSPYESLSSEVKALKVYKGLDAATGQKTWYYIEARKPLGFDNYMGIGLTGGVVIHLGTDATPNSSDELDMTPGTSSFGDAALAAGQTYSDTAAGINITVVSSDINSTNVNINLGTVSCTLANPSLTLSPTNVSLSPGQSASVNYTITNNDSGSCPPSTFSVTPTLPAGFSQSPTSVSQTLSPGTFASGTFIATTPVAALPGPYIINETAQNTSQSTYKSALPFNITIVSSDTVSPTTSITSPLSGATIAKKGTVNITASAADDIGITKVEFYVSGALICSDTTVPYSCSWKVPASPNKTYTLQSKAYDAAGNMGTSASISVLAK